MLHSRERRCVWDSHDATGARHIRAATNGNLSSIIPSLASGTTLEWVLRVGAFLCFLGHGVFGLLTKPAWVAYFGVAGIGEHAAYGLMPAIGIVDIMLGFLILVRPTPIALYWMVVWTIWTAALRPLSGESVWEFFERAGNYGVPAALLASVAPRRALRAHFARSVGRPFTLTVLRTIRRILTGTTALLLLGHGMLGVQGKAQLTANYSSLIPSHAPSLVRTLGWIEITLALAVALYQSVPFALTLAVWKLGTESLFFVAGAPAWEVVERGGSYAAPLALAIVIAMMNAASADRRCDRRGMTPA